MGRSTFPSPTPLDFANAPDHVEWRARAPRIDFPAVNRAALARWLDILRRWLPDGRRENNEWVARNPTRHDRRPGSFRINLETGVWADFATGDKGGDPISLCAYLDGCSQLDAAKRMAAMLGVEAR